MADGQPVLDMDALLAAKRAADGKPAYGTKPDDIVWAVMKLGGQEFRVRSTGNEMYAFEVGDMVQGASLNYVLSFFHPADRLQARATMEGMELDMEGIGMVMDELSKVVAGRPTQLPASSPQSSPPDGPSSTGTSSEPAQLGASPASV